MKVYGQQGFLEGGIAQFNFASGRKDLLWHPEFRCPPWVSCSTRLCWTRSSSRRWVIFSSALLYSPHGLEKKRPDVILLVKHLSEWKNKNKRKFNHFYYYYYYFFGSPFVFCPRWSRPWVKLLTAGRRSEPVNRSSTLQPITEQPVNKQRCQKEKRRDSKANFGSGSR